MQTMSRKQIMDEMGYTNLRTVSATLCRVRKVHPEVTVREGSSRKILINPYLMPKTTREERKKMETLYWELDEKIGQRAINRGVADFLKKPYSSVYFYFRNFNFIKRNTYNKYLRALEGVKKKTIGEDAK